MVKLKLNREQLRTVCEFTNPSIHEQRVNYCIENQLFSALDSLFNLVQIGESVVKKYLFSSKKKYTISLTYAEAASLLNHTYLLEQELDVLSYEYNEMIRLRHSLHFQITGFQRKFYGQTNGQILLAGTDTAAGGTLENAARYIGGGAN